jgi:asparagine synthase (glutamine-hydrolysing)
MNAGAAGPEGSVCAWEGRLDAPGPSPDPARTALDLYRGRGIAGFGGLIGDWSLVLWDDSSGALILASDYAGVRPLYYAADSSQVLWSSSLACLVRAAGSPELDEEWVAAFLTMRDPAGRTPYRGIRCVPPGHAVRFTHRGASVEKFWDLPGTETRLSGSREYAERLLELFHEAVEVRVRGNTHICAELSGGLDSSSVTGMAARLHRCVTTFSYTHPVAADEPYIRGVEEMHGLPAVHIDVERHPFVSARETGDAVPAWWTQRFRAVSAEAAALGANAILTGQLGDLVMGNSYDDSDQVAGHLRRFQLAAAGREAYAWSRALRIPIYPILWRAARMSFSSWTPEPSADLTPSSWQPRSLANSLAPRLERIAGSIEANCHEYNWREALPDRRRRYRGLARMLSTRRLQTPEPLQHLSFTHPFAHRPLVEFMMSIPPAEICRPGEPRRLMRSAFQRLLPPAVLRRRSKASFGDAHQRAIQPLAAEMLASRNLRVVDMEYIDRESLRERLDRFQRGLDCNAAQLQNVILLEFWLRNRDREAGA